MCPWEGLKFRRMSNFGQKSVRVLGLSCCRGLGHGIGVTVGATAGHVIYYISPTKSGYNFPDRRLQKKKKREKGRDVMHDRLQTRYNIIQGTELVIFHSEVMDFC